MGKRATKSAETLRPIQQRDHIVSKPAKEAATDGSSAAIDSLALNVALVEAQQRTFVDQQEALSFFYERLLEQFADDAEEKAYMLEFLELLIETDPVLKADLLAAVKIRE